MAGSRLARRVTRGVASGRSVTGWDVRKYAADSSFAKGLDKRTFVRVNRREAIVRVLVAGRAHGVGATGKAIVLLSHAARGTRVVSEYVGRGWAGELAAALDDMARAAREEAEEEERAAQTQVRAEVAETEAALTEMETTVRLWWQAALVAHGYHPHRRQWRKMRWSAGRGKPKWRRR